MKYIMKISLQFMNKKYFYPGKSRGKIYYKKIFLRTCGLSCSCLNGADNGVILILPELSETSDNITDFSSFFSKV